MCCSERETMEMCAVRETMELCVVLRGKTEEPTG